MRIRINGPNNIEKFPAVRYAKEWVKQGHMKTDDPNQITAKTTNVQEEELSDKQFFSESALF